MFGVTVPEEPVCTEHVATDAAADWSAGPRPVQSLPGAFRTPLEAVGNGGRAQPGPGYRHRF